MLLLAFAITNFQSVRTWSICSGLIAAFWIVLNTIQPKRHGLELSLNSSERLMFVTEDLNGVKQIVKQLYEFMESERDSTYTVNIDQSKATIGVGYAENISGTNN